MSEATTVRVPKTDCELMWDPTLRDQYGGNCVVADGREIIAYDPDPEVALAKAGAILGIDPALLNCVYICTHEGYMAGFLRTGGDYSFWRAVDATPTPET